MKKILFILSLFILVSCADVKITPQDKQVSIGYTTLVDKSNAATKVPTFTRKVFDNANIFQSYAFYLPLGTLWTYSVISGDNNSKPYFNTDVIVKKDITNNIWRDPNNDWYWPKTYALTFFAWSLNAPTLDFPTNSSTKVTCTDQNGIVATEYDIELNKNIDFLVADIAADKVANENVYNYQGVPTVFKHKLTQFNATISKKENYSGIEFTLNSIVFNNLNKSGNYTQNPDIMKVGTIKSNQTFTDKNQIATSLTPVDISNIDQYIYLPQDFDDNKTITITYTIGYDTNNDGSIDLEEPVTVTCKLSDLFEIDGFKPGTRYTLNIIFKMDEIYWDPVVEDWEDKSFTL